MRTQFVQWGLQLSLLEAKSPTRGPLGGGFTASRLSDGSMKVNVVVENGTMGPSMADDTWVREMTTGSGITCGDDRLEF